MVTTGFISNQSLVDLIRALTETEARNITYGVTTDGNTAILILPDDSHWAVAFNPEGDDYRVTMPDGRVGIGPTVADALAAARLA
jgi:hypothetical protein